MQSLLLDMTFGANERGIILFGFEIYYYALCIVSGMLLATFLSGVLMKRRNMSSDFVITLFVFCIPAALICTRLFYCITDGMPIREWFSWRSIREGGLSVIGGVLGGVGMGYIVCRVKKVEFFRAADCVVVTIGIAQAMGRWGNFFNMEVYGGVVSNPSLQWFPFAVPVSPYADGGIAAFSDPNATWHYAFFFYEILLNLTGFAILFTAAWFRKQKPNGILTFSYFIWYGVVRSVMEPLRDPQFILSGGGIPWSEVFSFLLIGLGVIGILCLLIRNFKREGSFVGSKRGDPYGISAYLTPYKDDTPYYSKINMFGANYPKKPPKGKKAIEAMLNEPLEGTEEEQEKPSEQPSDREGGDGGEAKK